MPLSWQVVKLGAVRDEHLSLLLLLLLLPREREVEEGAGGVGG